MFPDNAATDSVDIETCDITNADDYADMSTRELLVALHRRFDKVEAIAEQVQSSVAPMIEKISGNPMLKMFIK